MTRADLISNLYRHFKTMHATWMDFARTRGAGALMFFSEDFEQAGTFSELRWEFWERERIVNFIWGGITEDMRLKLGEEDFLTRINDTEFLSVVVREGETDNRFEFEIHRIDGAILN
jgi:hypothetical protein